MKNKLLVILTLLITFTILGLSVKEITISPGYNAALPLGGGTPHNTKKWQNRLESL